MHSYSLSNLSDATLIRDLKDLVARDRATTAALLAHIAEVDTRRLYAPAGFPSMFAYCVEELRLSEGAAYKRITAARAARKFPVLFRLVAEGRLHLTAIKFLAPHLTPVNAGELLATAIGLSAVDLEAMLVRRFGRADEPVRIGPVGAVMQAPQCLLEQNFVGVISTPSQLVSRPVETTGAGEAAAAAGGPSRQAAPAQRYRLEVTIGQATHDKLRHVQVLLGHSIPSGDVAQVLDRALDALIAQVEKQKFAATSRPQAQVRTARAAAATRRIPAAVRRAVWARDQGQCTFLGETLQRCHSRSFIEFDHIEPVARGGLATVENLRLRCRTHNQYEAERAFGAGFMAGKRGGTRSPAAAAPGRDEPLNSAWEESYLARDGGA